MNNLKPVEGKPGMFVYSGPRYTPETLRALAEEISNPGHEMRKGLDAHADAWRKQVRELVEGCIEGLEHDGMVRWSCKLCGDWVLATVEDDGPGLLHAEEDKRNCPANSGMRRE